MLKGAKMRIIDALIHLVSTTDIHKITVKKIVETASINRRTFYDHFENKEELIDFLESTILLEFKEIFNNTTATTIVDTKNLIDLQVPIRENIDICKHLKKYHKYYEHRLNDAEFYNKFSKEFLEIIQRYIKNERVSKYLTEGAIGYLNWWLSNDCKEPIELMAIELGELGFQPFMQAHLSKEQISESP